MRFIDLSLAVILSIILIPILLPVVIVLRLTGEGEVFYRQIRVGINGKRFEVYKFATMLKNSPSIGAGTITVKNDPRVLPVGKILRKTKINELPQLLNILKGEMSFIGPRPHAERDLEGVNPQILKSILMVTPGVSGVGSIVFRDEEKILHASEDPRSLYDNVIAPYKADLEIWYLKNKNLRNYLLLICITAYVVLRNDSSLIFRIFADLPKPPQELKSFLI